MDYALLFCGSPFTVGEAEDFKAPDTVHKMAATPESRPVMATVPESAHVSVELPELESGQVKSQLISLS